MEDKKLNEFIIYKITCNTNQNLIYIGSTKNFKCRKSQHKCCCINSNLKNYTLKLYQTIRENGGWDNWKIQPIEIYNTDNKTKARIRENELMEFLKANLNSNKAYISEDNKKIEKAIMDKKYYENNKEEIKIYKQQYYQNNKEICDETKNSILKIFMIKIKKNIIQK